MSNHVKPPFLMVIFVFSSHVAGIQRPLPQGGVVMPAIGDSAAWNAGYLKLLTMFRL